MKVHGVAKTRRLIMLCFEHWYMLQPDDSENISRFHVYEKVLKIIRDEKVHEWLPRVLGWRSRGKGRAAWVTTNGFMFWGGDKNVLRLINCMDMHSLYE